MNDQNPRVSVVIPTYKRAHLISRAIQSVLDQTYQDFEIIVVDDGSFDETPSIVKRLSDTGRVVAHFHERNCGKGAALRHALELAKEDYLVIQDADLEYDPQDFYAMAGVVQERGAQVVYGSRFLSTRRTGMLWTHYFGNRFLTMCFNVLYGQRLTDMETCYKLFRTDLIQQLGITNDRFDIDPELTAKIVRAGHKIYEVPVSYTGRPYLAGKKIRPVDALSAIKTLWDYRHWQPELSPTKQG